MRNIKRIISLIVLTVIILSNFIVLADSLYPISPGDPPPSPPPSPPTRPTEPGNGGNKGEPEDGQDSGIKGNKDIVGFREESSVDIRTQNKPRDGQDIIVNVELNQKLKNLATTVVLDVAKFNLHGFPYEIEMMKEYIKELPEYKYADIIDIKEYPITLGINRRTGGTSTGRSDYYDYEYQLVQDGIVRQHSDINYNLEGGYFEWYRDTEFTYESVDLINKSEFLSTLGRVGGIIDDVYISARSTATWVETPDMVEVRLKGRQKIEDSPYRKDVLSQVDIGRNIVLVDYNNRDYILWKLDNMVFTYVDYLVDIGVIKPEENAIDAFACTTGKNKHKQHALQRYNMKRVNYDKIDVSELIVNEDDPKDFEDWHSHVDVRQFNASEGARFPYPNYQVIQPCRNEGHQEYTYSMDNLTYVYEGNSEFTGNEVPESQIPIGANQFKMTAQSPQIFREESLSELDALRYIYRFMKYHEEEEVLNKLEVDTIVSLYGIQLYDYNDEDVEILKYLIAKGIIDPYEDNLRGLESNLLYKDMLKYIFRLAYKEKRFDFKKLTLTAEDVLMLNNNLMKNNITLKSEDMSEFLENLENSMEDFRSRNDVKYVNVYLPVTRETVENGDYIVTDSQNYGIVFESSPIRLNGMFYINVLLPESYPNSVVLRSTKIGKGYKIKLEDWVKGGIYELDSSGTGFNLLRANFTQGARAIEIDAKRYMSPTPNNDHLKITMDSDKPYMYKGVLIWDNEIDNFSDDLPDRDKFEYNKNQKLLTIKNISTENEALDILGNIAPPSELSASDQVFMGYSKVNMEGKSVDLIRDKELEKFGIEIIEDNILYNKVTDTYAYLDLRTEIFYHGNSVIKFEPGYMMVDYVDEVGSRFYNLDIVKSMLSSNLSSNTSVANQILTKIEKEIPYKIKDKDGYVLDTAFMYDEMTEGGLWLNATTLSGKNSNFIFYQDKSNPSLMLHINYRAVADYSDYSPTKRVDTDSRFESYLNSYKNQVPEEHPSVNALLQSIMAYQGIFTDSSYDYGINIIYNVGRGGGTLTLENRQNMINQLLTLISMEYKGRGQAENVKRLFKSLYQIGNWSGVFLPSIPGLEDYVDNNYTLGQFYNEIQNAEEVANIRKSTHLGDTAAEINRVGKNKNKEVPVLILNNNIYFRYADGDSIADLRGDSKTRMMSTLSYAYKRDKANQTLTISDENSIYTDTPADHIPLEHWKSNRFSNEIITSYIPKGGNGRDIQQWSVGRKVTLTKDEDNSYLLDKITYKSILENNVELTASSKWLEIDIHPSDSIQQIRLNLYNAMKSNSRVFKDAIENSDLEKELLTNPDLLKEFLNLAINDSDSLADIPLSSRGTTFTSRLRKNSLSGNYSFEHFDTEMYVVLVDYLIPAGTIVIDTSKSNTMQFEAKFMNTKVARGTKGVMYDIVNQSIAKIFEEKPITEMKTNDALLLPSGVQLVAIEPTNGKFVMTKGETVGSTISSSQELLWRYENDLNVNIGLTRNALNGIENINIPRKNTPSQNLFNNSLAVEKWNREALLTNGTNKVGFLTNRTLRTGKFKPDTQGSIDTDTYIDGAARVYPEIQLNKDLTVVELYQSDDSKNSMYFIRDVGMFTDTGFVDYLRDGVVDLRDARLESAISRDAFLDSAQGGESLIELFRLRNYNLIIGRLIAYVRYVLPWLLIIYGIVSGAFIILASTPTVKDFLWFALPEWIYYGLFRFLTVFSAEDGDEIPILHSFIKSSIVTAIGIIWLTYVSRSLIM